MISMNAKVILNNAFLAKSKVQYLEISEIRKFCNILYDKLTVSYKYVQLHMTDKDVNEFCDISDQFIKGIGKIFCMHPVKDEEVEKINSVYDPDVSSILAEARKEFAEWNS